MTVTSEFMDADTPVMAHVRIADGGRMLVRAAQRFAGVTLGLAALGLWLAPGAGWESDVMLFKLILSLTAVIAGLALLQSSVRPRAPQIEIDTIRREVRLVRPSKSRARAVLQRCAFADLGRVERVGAHLRLWDHEDVFMAEVTMSDRASLNSLVSALCDAGKLA